MMIAMHSILFLNVLTLMIKLYLSSSTLMYGGEMNSFGTEKVNYLLH